MSSTGFNQLVDWLQQRTAARERQPGSTPTSGARGSRASCRTARARSPTYAAEIGTQVGHFLAGFAITFFSLFYFLYEGRGIFTFLLKFFPRAARARVDQAALQGLDVAVAYVRAAILVALVGRHRRADRRVDPRRPGGAGAGRAGLHRCVRAAGRRLRLRLRRGLVALVALGWVKALIMLAGIIVRDADRRPHAAAVPARPGGQAAPAGRAAGDRHRHHRRPASSAR